MPSSAASPARSSTPIVVDTFVEMIEQHGVAFRHTDETDFERELAFERRVKDYARPEGGRRMSVDGCPVQARRRHAVNENERPAALVSSCDQVSVPGTANRASPLIYPLIAPCLGAATPGLAVVLALDSEHCRAGVPGPCIGHTSRSASPRFSRRGLFFGVSARRAKSRSTRRQTGCPEARPERVQRASVKGCNRPFAPPDRVAR